MHTALVWVLVLGVIRQHYMTALHGFLLLPVLSGLVMSMCRSPALTTRPWATPALSMR